MELKDIREKIDQINSQMTELFIERMKLSKLVAEEKSKNGLPINNFQRERQIVVDETAKMDEEIVSYGKQFYENLFALSKAYQSKNMTASSKMIEEIKAVLGKNQVFPNRATVACQGVLGAYSQIAADKMIDVCDILYFKDFDGVFTAVEKGMCRYGVLPIENSSVGSVNAVYDAMLKHNFYIVKAFKLMINHYLLAKPGVKIEDVKEIYSHEKAISQCSELLKKLGIKATVCENTAVAAQMVASSDRKDIACISSIECAEIYNLSILLSNVQNSETNFTRFILISKNLEIYDDASKISVMVNLKHEAGSLNNILSRFSALGLNLTKLESRPIPESAFEFAFYFDFEGSLVKEHVQNIISELENSCPRFEFLGSYNERIG